MLNIVLGIVISLVALGFLGLLLLSITASGADERPESALTSLAVFVMVIGMFIFGAIGLINGYFGLKLACMRQEASPYV